MALGYLETKTLQALRAGPMESWQLIDRLGSSSGLSKLITLGYAKQVEGIYSITPKGIDNCPTRRSTESVILPIEEKKPNKETSEIDIPVFINAGLPIEKGPSMEINQSSVADQLKATDKPEPVLVSDSPDYSGKPKAYQMLKYIEAHTGCTSREIMEALGMDPNTSVNPYIKTYLEREEVITANSENGRIYRVTKPVDQFYRHRKPISSKQPGAAQHDSILETKATPKANDDRGGMSQELSVQMAATNAAEKVQEAGVQLNQAEVARDQSSAKVRFAITHDRHMILMGLAAEDIELTEADSFALIKFCGDIALAANVSDALANRIVDLETLGS